MPNLLFRFTAIKKDMAVVGLYFKGALMAVKVLRETGRHTNEVLETLNAIFGSEMTSFIDLLVSNASCCLTCTLKMVITHLFCINHFK